MPYSIGIPLDSKDIMRGIKRNLRPIDTGPVLVLLPFVSGFVYPVEEPPHACMHP